MRAAAAAHLSLGSLIATSSSRLVVMAMRWSSLSSMAAFCFSATVRVEAGKGGKQLACVSTQLAGKGGNTAGKKV